MKKFFIFLIIICFMTIGIWYVYQNYKINYKEIKSHNSEYEKYLNQDIYGIDLTTIINSAIDYNEQNNVAKDENDMYIDNNNNSIKIEVKIIDNKTTYQMEDFYKVGMENFLNYYGAIKFKCTKLEYHNNNFVKYLLFEQITE